MSELRSRNDIDGWGRDRIRNRICTKAAVHARQLTRGNRVAGTQGVRVVPIDGLEHHVSDLEAFGVKASDPPGTIEQQRTPERREP
ncbi:hypothetical protein D3C71_1681070 [compost metagenome]